MKTIIIGAGRGRRLMPLTEETPKCFATVKGKRILDWILEAWRAANVTDIVFVGGYQIQRIQDDYPAFRFYHNTDWQQNNILVSAFSRRSRNKRTFRLHLCGHHLSSLGDADVDG